MNNTLRRIAGMILTLALVVSLGAQTVCAAVPTEPEIQAHDGAAFGTWLEDAAAGDTLFAWTDDSVSLANAETLLNSITVTPQRTGYQELDAAIAGILATASEDTVYARLKAAYDWLVKEVTYSWDGYSYTVASVKCYNSFTMYDYLKDLTYEDGLQKSIPDDMANRAYHVLTQKKGVCYDYSIAFAVIARYVGIDAYVHTGLFTFEDTSLGAGHHGWTILDIGGEKYLFDPQRDARNWQYYGKNHYYFCIDGENMWRYDANASDYRGDNKTANAQRDASMLSVTADRAHKVTVSVSKTGSGTVTGAGSYITGNTVTLTASPAEGYGFGGWFDAADTALGYDLSYSFTAKDDTALTAKFFKPYTLSISASRSGTVTGAGSHIPGVPVTLTAVPSGDAAFRGWYDAGGTLLSTNAAYSCTFQEDTHLNALFGNDVFCDIAETDWYLEEALEAHSLGLINGVTDVTFDGTSTMTRGMVALVLYRIAGAPSVEGLSNPFQDIPAQSEAAYYSNAVIWAYHQGIVQGRYPGCFDPDASVTRQEFCTMLIRYMEQHAGYDDLASKELSGQFVDADQIAAFAQPAMSKAVAIGILQGRDNLHICPTETLMRCEATAMLVRAVNYMTDNPVTE